LMDVNADNDDWSAFESAPTNVQPNLSANTANSNDSSTSRMTPTSSQLSWGLPTTLTSSSAPAIQRTQSPDPRSQQSRLSNTKNPGLDTFGWGNNPWETTEGSSTPSSAMPSPVVMTKEEKALEMTRRKEERKQRIAMLKEQKKAATRT